MFIYVYTDRTFLLGSGGACTHTYTHTHSETNTCIHTNLLLRIYAMVFTLLVEIMPVLSPKSQEKCL